MRGFDASKPARAGGFLALGCVGFIATAPALAQEAEEPTQLRGVTVVDTAVDEDVKAEEAESPKYTQPLLDTPQTVTVLTETTLEQQNLLTLQEALTTLPGITFGAGEGGGGYGDNINLRGQSITNDIQIDNVRDSAQYNRSDTFNIEQIEVVGGANSVYAGSGSISGTVNLVTKRPRDYDLTTISAGIGTADYYRATIDSNVRVSDLVAVRLNAMVHRNEFADRDVEKAERFGIAPAVTIGIEGPTSLTFLFQHQEDDNTPVYGVPYYAIYGGLLPGADYSGYYGYRDVDYQDQTVDLATAIFSHDFSDSIALRNLTRYGRVEANILVNPPQGAYCLDDGTLANATAAATRCGAGQVPGTYYPSGPRGTTRLTQTDILFNQLDLTATIDTFGVRHNLTIGASASVEDFALVSGNSLRNPGGATPNPALPPIDISDPDPIYGGPVNFIRNSRQDGETTNYAIYLFDAIELGEMFEINGGVRYENNRAVFRSDSIATSGAVTRGAEQISDDDLFSYRVGAVFKPVPNASLYAAYGNSETPSSSSVRLGCGLPSSQTLGLDPCAIAPQQAENYEIGGKVDLSGGALQLTAALFRNERTNFPVASNDPLLGTLQVLDGRSRVDGVTLGATGRITPNWTIFANYSYLDSEVLQSVSDFCLANPGSRFTPPGGTAVTCPTSDVQAGNRLTNTPEHSGSLFTTYEFPFGLQIGYGLTYQGSFLLTNQTGSPIFESDDWITQRVFLGYELDNGLSAQLNIDNIFEERYFTAIRNNGWATPGEGRSAVLTIGYSF